MVNPDRNLYEPPYDDALLYDGDLEPERPRSRPLVVLLGTVVLAAFAGVVWVAYNQGIKQGQQGVPLLTADAGPTRIVPDQSETSPTMNPAPDKSYERLWGGGNEGDGKENVLPQPEQPRTTPAPQDVARVNPTSPEAAGGQLGNKTTDFTPPAAAPGPAIEDPQMDATTGTVASAPKSATQSTGAPHPITNSPPAVFGPTPQSEDITSALQPVESAPPVAAVPKPVVPKPAAPKPVTLAAQPSAPVVVSPPAAPVKETKTAMLDAAPKAAVQAVPDAPVPTPSEPAAKGGSVMIQLGSFPDSALAATAWSKIKSGNQGLLGSYSPSIKPAEIPGKGTWYRLRVGGFADKAAASEVCQQLSASGQACIVAAK